MWISFSNMYLALYETRNIVVSNCMDSYPPSENEVSVCNCKSKPTGKTELIFSSKKDLLKVREKFIKYSIYFKEFRNRIFVLAKNNVD